MKFLLPLLFSAVLMSGCVSETNPLMDATLEPKAPLVIEVPFETAGTSLNDPFFRYSLAGLSEEGALRVLGRPSEWVTSNLWVYWRYYSPEQARSVGGYDTLVVAFEHGKVSTVKLVSGEALRARLERRSPPSSPSRL